MHLFESLLAGGPVVADGAWGTELQARGLNPGECPDSWNLTHPAEVEDVARAYVGAGSGIILTNTFRANRISLAGHGLENRTAGINRTGLEISRRAANAKAKVFAAIGPSGRMLAAGDVTADELHAAFAEQAGLLAGADALVLETLADLEEARIALAAARSVSSCPVVVSMVFDSGRNRDRTMMGVTPEQAARELTAAGADAVGANCGSGVASYVAVCRRLRAATTLPVWIKPNAGLPELVEGRPVYRTTAREFAEQAMALVQAGAGFVGGCCGTSPAFIRALKERMLGCA
jgi:methionine synthase I (cobalamin-dependent)